MILFEVRSLGYESVVFLSFPMFVTQAFALYAQMKTVGNLFLDFSDNCGSKQFVFCDVSDGSEELSLSIFVQIRRHGAELCHFLLRANLITGRLNFRTTSRSNP